MRIRQLTAATTVAATALLLSACGSSPLEGKNGSEVADAAADALEKADAVHVTGEMEQEGETGEVDLHLQGDDATGTITFNGAELELISVDGAVYVKGAPEFWASFGLPEAAAAMFEDQWVILPAEASGGFDDFSLAGIVDSFRNPESAVKDEVRSGEVDGTDVVVVEQEDGSTLSVADDDPSYPLTLTNDGEEGGTMTFSRFGEQEDISAPEDAIDLADLGA
ncbi:UNVERIFIED_ORG: hypothetical protein E4P37_01635 [Bacillus sp. AZ43]